MSSPITGRELFYQGTNQLNFLLLAQRNIVLIDAFAVALATFIKKFDRTYLKLLSLFLLSFAIAIGVVSYQDFNEYMDTVEGQVSLGEDDRNLIKRWRNWTGFTYALIAFTSLLLIMFIFLEFRVLDLVPMVSF